MSDHTIDRDTPMARLRELAMDQRREVAPLPARLAEAQRRHARAQQNEWDVSDVVITKDDRIALLQKDHTQMVNRVTTQIFAATMERQKAERVHRHLPANTKRFDNG